MDQVSRLIHFNVNSIVSPAKKVQLIEYINRYNPEIVFLTETKLKPGHFFAVKNYNLFRADRLQTNGGGTAILVKNSINAKQVKSHSRFFESCAIKLKVSKQSVVCIAIYVPPTSNLKYFNFKNFFENFNESIICAGDFNARHTEFGDYICDERGNQLFELHQSSEFKVISAEAPTCYRSQRGSFIDHFVLSNDLTERFEKKLSNLVQFSPRDHTGISIHSDLAFAIEANNPILTRRLYNKANTSAINKYIECEFEKLVIPTNTNLIGSELDAIATELKRIFQFSVDKFVPTTEVAYRYSISCASKSMLTEKHRLSRLLSRRSKANVNDSSLVSIKSSINVLDIMLRNSLQTDRAKCYKKRLSQVKCNSDAFKFIRSQSCYKSKSNRIEGIFTDEAKNEALTDPIVIANSFADLFENNHKLTLNQVSPNDNVVDQSINTLRCTISKISFNENVSAKIMSKGELPPPNELLGEQQKSLLTSVEEVTQVIKSRRNKSSCGEDQMPNTIIKQFSISVLITLTIFFNHLIAIGHFPTEWKAAVIRPIPKNGKNKQILSNWRPISLLNCIAKIFEVLIERRIREHFISGNLFTKDQFGFRQSRSTVHALANFNNDVLRGLNRGQMTSAVLLDVQAAFDTVWQEALIHKMMLYNVNYQLCKIIYNYLRNRSFTVNINEVTSSRRTIKAGTPQGSCISALLFIIFVNDMPSDPFIKKSQFADDTMAYATHKNPLQAQNQLNGYLRRLFKYFTEWKIKINEGKSQFINIVGKCADTNARMRSQAKQMSIKINNAAVKKVNELRYLGMWFSPNAEMKKHIDKILQKANYAFANLRHLIRSNSLPVDVKCLIFKAIIRPILSYASPAWANPSITSSNQMERIRIFERKTLRSATNDRRAAGTFKYTNSAIVYRNADTIRFDRFVAQNSINFFEKCSQHDDVHIRRLALSNCQDVKYWPPSFWKYKHDRNLLLNDGKLLLFNRSKFGQQREVYPTSQ